MIIEFSNASTPKNHSSVATAIVITASALFFIPTTLIILGYYSSQPTGSLISPLPQGTLSQTAPTPTPTTNPEEVNNQAIIAAPNDATQSANSEISSTPGSNIVDKVAVIEAGATEIMISDTDVSESSQIYLSPRPGDKSVYSLLSKTNGSFTIMAQEPSDTIRYIDYHIVNP
ncbi:MAG TPA: hypothetical protein PLI45_04910 [Candidatus Woesebacteria bacterium]|nr:hypothetical protein [Candidatus Woesebacteria bacterium]